MRPGRAPWAGIATLTLASSARTCLIQGAGRPREDVCAAVMDRVEHGRAPQALEAARQSERLWTDPRVGRSAATSVPTRLLGAYPVRVRWTGKGSIEDASAFCREGDEGVFR